MPLQQLICTGKCGGSVLNAARRPFTLHSSRRKQGPHKVSAVPHLAAVVTVPAEKAFHFTCVGRALERQHVELLGRFIDLSLRIWKFWRRLRSKRLTQRKSYTVIAEAARLRT